MRKSKVHRMVLATCLGSFLLVIFYFQSSLNPAAEDRILGTSWHGKSGRSPLQALYDSDQVSQRCG
uniref:Uncharacterized protein n=1 Tax=Sphenodon punctatus TaxID=8508 RepID=A0A8D0GH29_SPHPU